MQVEWTQCSNRLRLNACMAVVYSQILSCVVIAFQKGNLTATGGHFAGKTDLLMLETQQGS